MPRCRARREEWACPGVLCPRAGSSIHPVQRPAAVLLCTPRFLSREGACTPPPSTLQDQWWPCRTLREFRSSQSVIRRLFLSTSCTEMILGGVGVGGSWEASPNHCFALRSQKRFLSSREQPLRAAKGSRSEPRAFLLRQPELSEARSTRSRGSPSPAQSPSVWAPLLGQLL